MTKKLLIVFFFLGTFFAKAQCPQVFDYLGVPSNKPYFINCSGTGSYLMNIQSPLAWGSYTINWGDGSPNHVAGAYTANSLVPHTYTTIATDTFIVTLMIPSLSCTMTGVVVMEKPVNSSIQIPIGGVTQACAPATLQFINSSTDVSATTTFTWNFGDGSPPVIFNYTNAAQTISHTYSVGTVNCQTAVTLMAMNYCSFGNPTTANFNPIQIYDRDVAAITPDAFVKCLPNTSFTFSNTTTRNCLAQGNTFQRQEEWNFGDYWGMGHDSILPWRPWPPTTPITINYPGIGTYSVVLRDSNLCGVSTRTINVSIIAAPIANFNVPPNPLCQNAPVTFTNTSTTGYFYKWDFGVGAGYVNTSYAPQTFTYTTPGTYTVMNVVYFAAGCSDTAKQVITILPAPTASFVMTPTVGCNTLTAVSFTDVSVSAIAWNWNFGNGNTSASQTPPAQTYTTIGNSVITLTVTGANSCRNIRTSTVTVFQSPVAAFSPTSSCVGSAVTFTDQSTAASTNTITNWNWNFGDGSPTTVLQNPVHTFTANGTYTVTLVVNSAVCSSTLAQNFLVNVKPTAAFTVSPLSGCPTLTVNFTNGSANATSFLWDFGTTPTFTSNATNPVFNYTNSTASAISPTITLIAMTGAGCSDTATQSINVFPKPIASFTVNTTPGCSPLALTFTNTSTGALNYNWDFGDGNNSILTSPVHTYTNATLFAQTFTVQLIATNSNGCTDTTTQVITTFPKPLFTFTMIPASGCSPLNVNFPTIPGAVTTNWDFGDGNTSTSLNPTHTFTNTTLSNLTFTVTLIAQNAFMCVDTAYGMPIVFPKPIANFLRNPVSGCSPLLVNFVNTSTLNVGNNWDFDDGNLSTLTNPAHTFTTNNTSSNTVYNVQLLVISADGCRDSVQKTVTLLPLPQADFSVDTPACSPKILTFTNLSSGANTYNWNFGNSNTSTATSPTQQYINNSGINQTYTVQLIATNAVNCKDTLEVPIVVHSQPNYNITPSPTSGCAPLTTNFPAVAGAISYNWNFGDGNTSTSAPVLHTFVNVTTANVVYTVQLIASDAYSCADTAFAQVTVFPQPVANFQITPTTVNIPNDPIHCTNLSTGTITSNYWTFGDGGTSTATNPDYDYTTEGEYQVTLIVTSSNGCKDTFSLPTKIIVLEEASVVIPNAFTPNPLGSPGTTYSATDLSNDIFHPIVKGVDKDRYELSIYSRWGELLFMTKETNEGWDGYYKGKICTQDVYVWKLKAITLDGKIINKTGDVLLLK
ncbi:MAG: PKD domain-containing protein [Bacteroidia bacterium]|nr:PKD domain-containing protein [Bacteroidia bacterium]